MDFVLSNFLVPATITGLLAFTAAGLKFYEYRHQQHWLDLLMWVGIVTRMGIGTIYLLVPADAAITDRTTAIRFCITLLLLAEILRGARKVVARKRSREVIDQLAQLGYPEEAGYRRD